YRDAIRVLCGGDDPNLSEPSGLIGALASDDLLLDAKGPVCAAGNVLNLDVRFPISDGQRDNPQPAASKRGNSREALVHICLLVHLSASVRGIPRRRKRSLVV